MGEETSELRQGRLEERSRELFQESVQGLDMRVRSRLTQARHAALEAAQGSRSKTWFLRMPVLTSAAGAAMAVLGVALWFGGPMSHHSGAVLADQSALEDLELVSSSEDNNVEMLQDDLDFYAWADKTEGAEPTA
jgi:hypothetical protein